MTPWCREVKGGIIIRIRVVPRSSRPGIQGVEENHLKVRLKSPPVEGKANKELMEVLAKALKIPKGKVEIVKGQKARTKEVFLEGITPGDLEDLS